MSGDSRRRIDRGRALRTTLCVLLATLVCAMGANRALAKGATATITGTVVDPQGLPTPDVTLTLKNLETNDNLDSSALKSFPLPFRETNLQFRADFFNLFNLAPLGVPDATATDTNFGQITSTATTEREIQFALKLYF